MAESQSLVEVELLQRALSLPPTGFEDLVMRLLGAMGYGQAGYLERTSASGDAVSTGSSARTRSALTESSCRPSATPKTE